MMNRAVLTAFAMLTAGLSALAPSAKAVENSELRVVEAWARATPGGATVGAAYADIHAAAAEGDKLLSVSTPAAGRAEIHTHIEEDGVMKMRRIEALELPPGAVVKLKPGGKHLMLFDLKAPLAEGGTLPLTLTFEKAGRIEVTATISPIGANAKTSHPASSTASGEGPKDKNGSHSGSHSGQD